MASSTGFLRRLGPLTDDRETLDENRLAPTTLCGTHGTKHINQSTRISHPTDLALLEEEDNLLSSSTADDRNNHDEEDVGFFRIPLDPDLGVLMQSME